MTTTDPGSVRAVEALYDELYERYGRALEAEHAGELRAVSPDGWTVLGQALIDVAR